MVYLPPSLIELRNEVLMCYLITKSLWNLDFKNDYKTIYSQTGKLIELKIEVLMCYLITKSLWNFDFKKWLWNYILTSW